MCILLLLLPLVPRQEGGGTDTLAQVSSPVHLVPGGNPAEKNDTAHATQTWLEAALQQARR